MDEQEVIAYMGAATSKADWNDRVDEVKRRCDGYPDFWYAAIVESAFIKGVAASWDQPDDGEIHIYPISKLASQ